jgi:lysophospholipase L1-like esterase
MPKKHWVQVTTTLSGQNRLPVKNAKRRSKDATMMTKTKAALCRLIGLVMSMSLLAPASLCQPLGQQNDLKVRAGLPHVALKLRDGKPVTVAFFGGSITAQMDGWRSQTMNWLKDTYPHTAFSEVDAAIPGTDSTLGAFRLAHDVLAKHPDLLLIEFSVNDSGGRTNALAMEGIVRQTWTDNPTTDICLVYTVSESLLPYLLRGGTPSSTAAAELVADHYGIPSVNFGMAVARAVDTGALVMRGARSQAASGNHPQAFSQDGTHPYPESGQRLYKETFARAFVQLQSNPPARLRWPVAPLDSGNLEDARQVTLDDVTHSEGWHRVELDDSTGDMARSLPHVWADAKVGDSLSFSFSGNLFGLYGVKGPDAGMFAIQIDHQAPITTTLRDPYSTAGRYRLRSWFSQLLPAGLHTVRIEVVDDGATKDPSHPTRVYLGAVLVNGFLR